MIAPWAQHAESLVCYEAIPGLNAQEGDQLVAAVIRHMLFRQHQKPDQPVRREELNKIIQSNYKARHAPCDGVLR